MSIWILVGDAASARLFESSGPGEPWTLLKELVHPESRAKASDLVTDRSGRQEERGVLPRDMEGARFAAELGALLTQGRGEERFERLVLVGPARFLGLLKNKLPKNVLDQLTDTLVKDFAQLTSRELEARIHGQLLV